MIPGLIYYCRNKYSTVKGLKRHIIDHHQDHIPKPRGRPRISKDVELTNALKPVGRPPKKGKAPPVDTMIADTASVKYPHYTDIGHMLHFPCNQTEFTC